VLLGGWAPGGAHDPAAAGALAYFRWLNARGGVFGRRIVYRVLDDRGNLRVVPSLVHRLVQGEAVFAVFGAAGVPGTAVTGFLDSAGVPDVFAGSGCSCVNVPGQLPGVFGWLLGDVREGKILGAYVAQHYAGQKVGVLYGPGRAGRDGLAGFKAAAGGVRVAARVKVSGPSQAAAGVRAARAAGARVLVAFTGPGVTAKMTAAAGALPMVAAGSGLADGLPDGVITDGFLPSAGAPARSRAGSWVALFRKIRDKYLPHAALSPAVIGGMASAYEMTAAMFRAGPTLTRPGLVAALNGLPPGPAGVPLAYTTGDHGGPEGAYVGLIRGGVLVPATGALVTGTANAAGVMPYGGRWAAAPSSGIPRR
jgi:ABC-type branched-subunit amino acid transport system substrate-binding protein